METSRQARIRSAAAARGIPLPTILTTCAVVVVIYLAGKLAYRMRDVLLMILVGAFLALILNPMVRYAQRWVHRRGLAVAIVLGRVATIAALALMTLLEGPKVWAALLAGLSPPRAERYGRMARAINQSVTGYVVGDLLTSLIAGVVVFVNPLVMSRTVQINPLLVLLSVLFGTSIGDWVGGVFGGFVAALLSIPCAAALQVIIREIWLASGPEEPARQVIEPAGEPAAEAAEGSIAPNG
jgi:predicted PurR-regulated permease PerM